MSSLPAEFAAAFRSLRRAPGFATLAVSMLALGIGTNVAIFSIFRSIILNPLPYAQPGELVGFSAANPAKALTMPALSASDFRDLKERAQSFHAVAVYRPNFVSFKPGGGDAVQLIGAFVTEEFFPLFGTTPL